MGNPQKPINTVNLGGVSFNSNLVNNYGMRAGADGKLKFFIDMKDGTKVEYSKQPKDPLFKFYEQPKEATITQEDNGRYIFANLQNADIDFSSKKDKTDVDVLHAKDVKVTGSENRDVINVAFSENCEVNSGAAEDRVFIFDSKNTKVNSGDGDDHIYALFGANHLDINGGSGADVVDIFEPIDERLTGKVHLDSGDKLRIINAKSQHVEIRGEGVHNLEETKYNEE